MDPLTAALNAVTALATFATKLVDTPAGQEQVKIITDIMSTVHNFIHHKTQDTSK